MAQAEGDRRLDEAGLVAAVEALAVEAVAVERGAADQARHGVGQLDLAAGAALLAIEHREHAAAPGCSGR